MKLRFSLRVLFIFTTVFAAFCYYWIVMPGVTAKRFIDSICAEDYQAADKLFWNANDRVLAQWKEKYWGFRSDAELLPWSVSQFLSGRREVQFHVTNFFLDEHHDLEMQIAANQFGIRPPAMSAANSSTIINGVRRVIEREDIQR